MALNPMRWRFTVAEYHQMAEAGILGEDDRVELIDGEVIKMTPIGSRHAACVARLTWHFGHLLGSAAIVWVQNPVYLDEYAELEPDVALLRPRPDFYASRHPTPGDVLLIVEVAQTSAEFDRRVKVPHYARSGIPEVWLADLDQQTVTVYRDPSPSGYRTEWVVHRGGVLSPLAFPNVSLAVADILG
ncbi:MAG: Uma2 family endonuclease [Chloroflexi bacterium]|nr:Uma2 family endonuclease [Chloroflexota bacterium]